VLLSSIKKALSRLLFGHEYPLDYWYYYDLFIPHFCF